MNVGSLFTGIGGFDLGLERAGMTTVLQVENDPYPIQVLERHWPAVTRHTDIKDVTADALSDVDVLCGGFPCQDISQAGRRAGLDGDRSGLWFEFARLIDGARPEWVLIENVPGLLSSNRGDDMAVILGTLERLGYELAWRTLDSQWFGVAQRRRRVFIVGHLGTGRAVEVLLEPEGVRRDSPPSRQAEKAVAALTATGVGTCGADDNQAQAGYLIPTSFLTKQNPGGWSDVAPTLPTQQGAISVHITQDPIHGVDLMHALSTKECGGALQGDRVRRLTPLECERLQGFDDGWTDCLSDTRRYRALGNAVTVNVAEWIGRRMVRA